MLRLVLGAFLLVLTLPVISIAQGQPAPHNSAATSCAGLVAAGG